MSEPTSFTIDVLDTDFFIMPEVYKDKCVGMTPHCLIYRNDGALYNLVYLTRYMDFMWPPFDISLLERRRIQDCIREHWTELNQAFQDNKLRGFESNPE